nr:YicC/YloC family endoribonuclease [Caldanaerobacter subterraneus]
MKFDYNKKKVVLMIKSMTGYGRSDVRDRGYEISVEIRSLNHRFLDVNIKLNRLLSRLEERVREFVSEKIKRGRVDLSISFDVYDKTLSFIKIDEPLLEEYLKAFSEVKAKFDLKGSITVSDLIDLPEVIKLENEEVNLEEVWEILRIALDDAIGKLIDMRLKEGIKLYDDVTKRIKKVSEIVGEIEGLSLVMVEDYRKKLEQRIKELGVEVDPVRISMEVALIADKSCIAEEITRLKSHISQFRSSLNEEGPIGKKLDFILQEMNREANTIASKAIDYRISSKVIDLKDEIEKIREQVQNIE